MRNLTEPSCRRVMLEKRCGGRLKQETSRGFSHSSSIDCKHRMSLSSISLIPRNVGVHARGPFPRKGYIVVSEFLMSSLSTIASPGTIMLRGTRSWYPSTMPFQIHLTL